MTAPNKEPTEKGSDLLTALTNATEADLAAVNGRIAVLEGELTTCRLVQRILLARFNPGAHAGGPLPGFKNGAGEKEPKGAKTLAYRKSAVRLLADRGPTKASVLADDCMIPRGSINTVIDHVWFAKTSDDFVTITSAARQAVL